MKLLIAALVLTFSTISHGKEPDLKRGEVVQIVPHPSYLKKTGKTNVLVWDGDKIVKVEIATNWLEKVIEGEIFPYKIKRDRDGNLVSTNRRGL